MDILKNQKTDLALLIFLLLVTALVVTEGNLTGFAVAGAITTGTELRWSNGSTATLLYDNNSQTYGDSSLVNDNMYLHVCSTVGGATDLINKYVKLVYRMQTNEIDLTVLPAQITSGSVTGNCADIDLDLSTFSAYYPGVVTVAVANTTSFSSPTYYQLSQITGFLKGNYTIRYDQVGSNISINASEIYDDQGNIITTDLSYMIVGIKNSTGQITHSAVTNPNNVLQFPFPTTNFSFVVNNFDVTLVYNLSAPEDCTNNIDDDGDGLIDCADPECAAHQSCQPPAPPAGGGGGGGLSYCEQDWECTDWSNCHSDGTQTRTCTDKNNCLNRTNIRVSRLVTNPKPPEIRTCTYLPQCDDQLRNQDETDIDCGGENCAPCQLGQHCLIDRDCFSSNCFKEVCRPAGFQCITDEDCPAGFTCEQHECLFLKIFRKPAKLTSVEKYILWILLALILLLSSYIAYERYKGSPYYHQLKEEKYQKFLSEFIKKANLQGYSKKEIKQALQEKGWPRNIINKYVNRLYQPIPTKPPGKKYTLKQEIEQLEEQLKQLK